MPSLPRQLCKLSREWPQAVQLTAAPVGRHVHLLLVGATPTQSETASALRMRLFAPRLYPEGRLAPAQLLLSPGYEDGTAGCRSSSGMTSWTYFSSTCGACWGRNWPVYTKSTTFGKSMRSSVSYCPAGMVGVWCVCSGAG